MSCRTYSDRLDAYLDGMLTPGEQEAVAEHSVTCAECAEALRQTARYREIVRELPEHSPPSGLRERILAATTRQPQPVRRTLWDMLSAPQGWAVAGAAVVLLAVWAVVDWNGRDSSTTRLVERAAVTEEKGAVTSVLPETEERATKPVVIQPPVLTIGAQVGRERSSHKAPEMPRAGAAKTLVASALRPSGGGARVLEPSPAETAIKAATEELEESRGIASWKFNEGSSRRSRELAAGPTTVSAKADSMGVGGGSAESSSSMLQQARWSGDSVRESRDQINDDLARVMGAIEMQSWMNAKKDKPVMRLVKIKT